MMNEKIVRNILQDASIHHCKVCLAATLVIVDVVSVGINVCEMVVLGPILRLQVVAPLDVITGISDYKCKQTTTLTIINMKLDNLKYNIDSWTGEIPFRKAVSSTEKLRLHIRATENGPTSKQLNLLQELDRRYDELWIDISQKLLAIKRSIKSANELTRCLDSVISISIPGVISGNTLKIVDFVLIYEFKKDKELMAGYFVSFVDWKIDSCMKAR